MELKTDVNLLKNFISASEFSQMEVALATAHDLLIHGNGDGREFTGWVRWPEQVVAQGSLLDDIATLTQKANSLKPDVIVVIGIGGSYLGTKAVYDALNTPFESAFLPIVYAGHHLDAEYHARLLSWLETRSPMLVVISKSGTTTEPAIAFRMLRAMLEKKYGTKANERIVVVTDENKGALRAMADSKGYTSFVIPDNIGGRYSVFTAVGLVPLALCGINVNTFINGAAECSQIMIKENTMQHNVALTYAAVRQILYRKGHKIELLATFHPQLSTLAEWWKQLFGESEGKQKSGIFPASVVYSTDLHSMGQYVQDGERMLFETFIQVDKPNTDIEVPALGNDDDGLLYLEGKSLFYVNQKATEGTRLAHNEGSVPVFSIGIPSINEYNLASLMYFFEFTCGISAYAMGVNPFDQPGVEAYKKKMFQLLGKP